MTRIDHLKIALGLMPEPVPREPPMQYLAFDSVRTGPDTLSLISVELSVQAPTVVSFYGAMRNLKDGTRRGSKFLQAGDIFTLNAEPPTDV